MKKKLLLVLITAILVLSACKKEKEPVKETRNLEEKSPKGTTGDTAKKADESNEEVVDKPIESNEEETSS